MRKFYLKALALGVGLFLSLSLLAGAPERQTDLNELRQQILVLQQELASKEEFKNEALDALKESELAISNINRLLHRLTIQKKQVEAALVKLNKEVKQHQEKVALQQHLLSHLLREQYKKGEQDGVKMMLNNVDPNQVLRELHYYTYIWRAQAKLINELRNNLQLLQTLQLDLQTKNQQLIAIEAEQQTQKNALQQQWLERKKVLAKVSAQVNQQQQQIHKLQNDEKRLSALIQKLGRIIKERKPAGASKLPDSTKNTLLPDASMSGAFGTLKGKLRLPVRGEIANQFGVARAESGVIWKGLFIRSSNGQEVRAVASGQVVFADWLRGFGNLIILDHGNSYMSLYGANEALLKQVGESVRAGDAIATVGNSGGNLDSGLYFELRYQGKPLDPASWIKLN